MNSFIDDVLALFKKKYETKNCEVSTSFIDLASDIKPSTNHQRDYKNYLDAQKGSSLDNEDAIDNLATFIVSSGKAEKRKSPSRAKKGRWITSYEAITIHNRTIDNGFFYFGGKLEMLSGFGIEPSLVDDRLPASSPKASRKDYSDDSLGYWSSYSQLSTLCRGAYLDWLASDRNYLSTPIGYVFIYFSGLERRVIESISKNDVTDDEFIAIYNEVFRLHGIYGDQSSFYNYSAQFLEFMALVRSPLFDEQLQAQRILPPPTNSSHLMFKMKLAKTVTLEQPIPAALAWEWLVFSNSYTFKTPAKRCASEFKHLFDTLYQINYPNGFFVIANKTKLKISYNAASRSIGYVELTLDDLLDPSRLKAPIKKLIAIADQCNDTLEDYSRYLSRDDHAKSDLAAVLLLPNVLMDQQAYQKKYPVIQEFGLWLESILLKDKGVMSVEKLWRQLDKLSSQLQSTPPKLLTKNQNEFIINLAKRSGFGIVPDQKYYHTGLKSDGYIAIFRGGYDESFEPSSNFYQLSLALRLGAMVAGADGAIDNKAIDQLSLLIDQDKQLISTEVASLKAYLLWCLNTPASLSGLKVYIDKISSKQIGVIGQSVLSVALVSGHINPNQIKQIEKIYLLLGLDKNAVVSDIHHMTSSKKSLLYTITPPKDVSENICRQDDANQCDKPFVFDKALLALYESETTDAKAMLADIFIADDDIKNKPQREDLTSNQVDETIVNEQIVGGLDDSHRLLYQELINKEVWSREEIEKLCQSLNLMMNAAIETVNDWAYDLVDASVLEDDDDIVVDFEIVEELKALNEP